MSTNLCIFITLGLPLLICYYNIMFLNKKDQENLWTNNGKNIVKYGSKLRLFYKFSIIFSTIAGLYLMYYLTYKINTKSIFSFYYNSYGHLFIEISLLVFIGFSLLWLPAFYSRIISIKFVLFMVSMGSLLLFLSLLSIEKTDSYDYVAIFCAGLLFFQHFFMDFLIWSY